jgi:ABC transport system ATP-binding/permease protein
MFFLEKISKSYSEKVLFDEISFGIQEGAKIGLIGVNGTGKSTLLKIIAGVEKPDGGQMIAQNGKTISYLSQNPHFEKEATVLEQVFHGDTPMMNLLREYENALLELNQKKQGGYNEEKWISLNQRMDAMDGWRIEREAKSILTKLGIHDFHVKMEGLSGGQRKRIAMASVLIHPMDLLILDEPTNHMDNDVIEWLEQLLNQRKGALLMVTHDRYFLDRVVDTIIELDQGRLFRYAGNYSQYLESKILREELEESIEKKRQNLLKKELEWIRKGPKARGTKQKARIDRFETLLEDKPLQGQGQVEVEVSASRLGKKILEIHEVEKSYSDKKIIKDFSYLVLRDDRIGIIGPNGTGKSTLLKIIAGKCSPDSGHVEQGQTVKIGYFSQENDEMNEELRVIQYIQEEAMVLKTSEGELSASRMLERFLFPPSTHGSLLKKLSGGEKRRLTLLKILMGAPNVLMLDEPTNDLDVSTLHVLENYIDEFPGAVIVVSHDRYFLDRVTQKLFCFEGERGIQIFQGNYSEYAQLKKEEQWIENSSSQIKKGSMENKEEKKLEKPLKFSYKEQKEFETIDEVIATLEKDLVEIDEKIKQAQSDFIKLQGLLPQKEALEKAYQEAEDRWIYLNERAEEIEKNKKM